MGDNEFTLIPPAFWANFDPAGALAEKRKGTEVRRLYADRQTYEDWFKGDFVVWHRDGRKEQALGVQINKADFEAEFGPMHSFQ